MLVPGDLGFQRVAALFIFVVFPALCFVFIRRKWRLAASRREEISRLLVLAAEEAARAEFEASIGYATAVPLPSYPQCAVCYTPTHNRCGRCKSVYYCSGKCQIVHWRQGHKDECHPPLASFQINEEAINFVGNTVKQKQPYPDDYSASIRDDEIQNAKQGETAEEKPGFTNPVYSPSEFSLKDDNDTVDRYIHGKEPDSLSELHGISVSSGHHASFPSDRACTNDPISDDDSLHDISSDSCESSSPFDKLETASRDRIVEQSEQLEERFYMRVESNGDISGSGDLKEETLGKATGSSVLRISHSQNNSAELSTTTSGFWDGSLDSNRTRKYAKSNSAKLNTVGSGDGKLSNSNSSLQFSFNVSGDFSSDVHSRGSEVADETYPCTSKTGKPVAEPTLPGEESTDAARNRSSTILSSKRSETRDKEIYSDGDSIKCVEVGTAIAVSKGNGLPSNSSERANNVDQDTKNTSLSLSAKDAGSSPKIAIDPSSSGMRCRTDPAAKSLKAGSSIAMAPQVASFTPSASVGLKSSMLKVVEQLRAPRLSRHSDGVGRNSEKAVFSYESFVKLYHWKVEMRPCGLVNCGNSCYANVVLQCLAFTPPLTAYLLQGLHSKGCAKKEWCFTCEFERLVLKAKEGGPPVSPLGILSQIQKIGSHLANGREEDAHEFLRYAIDMMQSMCLQEAGVSSSSSLEEETNLMGLTFGGYLRSKIKCARCHGKSERQERMMDLTVEIEGDIETLEDALRRFTKTECLDGENKYHCGRCKSYEKAKKKLSILEAPNVLNIALKRFQSGKFGKLNKTIRFPEILNLAPYMRGASDKSPIYRLYGVVVHLDIMNASFSGHYVCYVRNAQNKWYKIDDSTVKAVELDRVLNKGAYMLFYSRCSPRAPRSIRSNIISRDLSSKMKNPEVGPSHSSGRNSYSRQREPSVHGNHIRNGSANLDGYALRDETTFPRIPNTLELDSSSDSSSLFSHSDEVSSSTDSNRESISADDISDYIFSYNAFGRQFSDSDTSSSSSSSSSSSPPPYTKHSPLSDPERYASGLSEQNGFRTHNPCRAKTPLETCRAMESGSGGGGGVSFLHSNSSKQVKKLVDSRNSSSSSSGADSDERLGWAKSNPLDNAKSGVYLRRSSRKKAD